MTTRNDWAQFVRSVRDEMGLLPRSLRTRIAVTFGVLALATSIPAYFYISHVYLEQLTHDKREKLQVIADSAATIVGQSLYERRREVALLAEDALLENGTLNSAEVKVSLEQLKRSRAHYSWIGVADSNGMVMSATSDWLKGESVLTRPWFAKGRESIYVGDLHEAVLLSKLLGPDASGQPVRFIDFSAPIRAADGHVRGVVGAHAHWKWAGDIMSLVNSESLRSDNAEIFIVNVNNTIIFPAETSGVQTVPVNLLDGQSFHRWSDGQDYLTVGARVPEEASDSPLNWKIYVRQPKSVVTTIVANLQVVELLAVVAAGSVFLLFSWLSADRIARPLEQLTAIARNIQSGQEHQQFDVVVNSQEIMDLQSALSAMSTTLVERRHALERNNLELEEKVHQRTMELERANRTLEQLAMSDSLTGLPNRLATDARLKDEFLQLKRGKGNYAVLMVDVDHFKRINDTWGHAVGDAVLKQVAETLRRTLRETDFVGRIGGEEFLAILSMTSQEMALKVAEKVRAVIAETTIDPVGSVTISIGMEEAHADQSSEQEAVRGADQWLYQAKKNGRNRVESIC